MVDELFAQLAVLGVPDSYNVSFERGTWWINYGDDRSEAGLGWVRAAPIFLLGVKEWLAKQPDLTGFRVQVGQGTKAEYSALIWPTHGAAFSGRGRDEFMALGMAVAEYAKAANGGE